MTRLNCCRILVLLILAQMSSIIMQKSQVSNLLFLFGEGKFTPTFHIGYSHPHLTIVSRIYSRANFVSKIHRFVSFYVKGHFDGRQRKLTASPKGRLND